MGFINSDMIRKAVSNMDEEDVAKILNEFDWELAAQPLNDKLEPHLEDVRDRAQSAEPKERRKMYENLSDERQQKAFETTVADLILILRECREQPKVGMPKLKSRLRDPDVVEPLLLIFNNDDHITDEYSKDMKETVSSLLAWGGASVLPEMYTEQELKEIERRLQD